MQLYGFLSPERRSPRKAISYLPILRRFLVSVGLVSFFILSSTANAQTPTPPANIGVYEGNSVDAHLAFESWLGKQVYENVFTGFASWSDYDGSIGWIAGLFAPLNGRIRWSIPLIPTGATLAAAANGDYNAHYLQAAQVILANSPADNSPLYIRTGWEFNGNWFPWAAQGLEQNFIGAYRAFVTEFRSVSPRFKFEWNANVGLTMDPSTAYPGDAYVDYIGMDFYYNSTWDNPDPIVEWYNKVNEPYGLQWLESFATAHGKPSAYSEWGINVDSPQYIQNAAAWFSSHNVAYQGYWDSNADIQSQLSQGQYPNAAAAYRAAFALLTVSITSPTNGSTFTAGTNITITASPYDTSGTVTKVEFYQGGTKLGEATSSPWSFTWNSVAAGNYSLTAMATDNNSASTTSVAISITVQDTGGIATNGPSEALGMYGSDLSAWENTLGRPANSMITVPFVADSGGWVNYDGSAWYLASTLPTTRRLAVGVGFFPAGAGSTMAEAANGSYDSHYLYVAQQLAGYGHGDAIIRPAWEFNGGWYAWGYKAVGTDQANYGANYRAAWIRLRAQFLSVSANFKFAWNPNLEDGYTYPDYQETYPGDAYVDMVGFDVYDRNYNNADPDNALRWAKYQAGPLAGLASFAVAHNKPVCLPEWAAGDTPGGDNPYFINAMADWLEANTVAYQSYWSGDGASGYNGNLELYPNQKAAFIARFGNASTGTTVHGIPYSWLASYGIANTNNSVETENPDGDGLNNLQEYIAGTDPTNRNSCFSVGITNTAAQTIVCVPSIQATGTNYASKSRYYGIEQRTNLLVGSWQPVPGYTNVSANGSIISCTNAIIQNLAAFYRSKVWLQ
jgi:beta-mannanase